jgi:energy-coupling factor transport system permease protein
VIYRRGATPLHAARAVAGGAWCLALAALALSVRHPLVLVGLALVVLAAAIGAGAGRTVARTMAFSAPFALLIALINMVVYRDGLTVIVRLGELPPFGQLDLTLEALVYGLVFGLRIMVVIAVFALASVAVDPDQVLALFRRLSLRSALAAALATRMLPVLTADARRIDEARRCRPDGGGHGARARVAVLRAVTAGALDRSLDVAATLEVRGYATAVRGPLRRSGRPWSRHDVAFLASAVVLVAVAVLVRIAAFAEFSPYPLLRAGAVGEAALLVAAVAAIALLPFINRRGIEP